MAQPLCHSYRPGVRKVRRPGGPIGDRLGALRCDDADSRPRAPRGCIILHDRAWD
jgi:hypothetical protein